MVRTTGNGNGNTAVLDVPVEFGGVSIGETTARLGCKISRDRIDLDEADSVFVCHRLTGYVRLGANDSDNGQGTFVDDLYDQVDGSFDVKRIGVNADVISTGLTFSLADVEVATLAKFSKGHGRLVVNKVGAIPEPEKVEKTPEGKQVDDAEWRKVALTDVLDVKYAKILADPDKQGGKPLETVGGLQEFLEHYRLTDLKGIGEAAAQKIEEQLTAFWEANPQFSE